MAAAQRPRSRRRQARLDARCLRHWAYSAGETSDFRDLEGEGVCSAVRTRSAPRGSRDLEMDASCGWSVKMAYLYVFRTQRF